MQQHTEDELIALKMAAGKGESEKEAVKVPDNGEPVVTLLKDRVSLSFGKPRSTLVMTLAQARQLALVLRQASNTIERQRRM